MSNKITLCVLCNAEFKYIGNNPWPLSKVGSCCDSCNYRHVMAARGMTLPPKHLDELLAQLRDWRAKCEEREAKK